MRCSCRFIGLKSFALSMALLCATPVFADRTPNSLKAAVQSAISGGNVQVVLVDGVATLTGYANSLSIQAAERAARNHEAVDSVINLIGNTM